MGNEKEANRIPVRVKRIDPPSSGYGWIPIAVVGILLLAIFILLPLSSDTTPTTRIVENQGTTPVPTTCPVISWGSRAFGQAGLVSGEGYANTARDWYVPTNAAQCDNSPDPGTILHERLKPLRFLHWSASAEPGSHSHPAI